MFYIAFVAASLAVAPDDELVIDNFYFSWRVDSIGERVLSVVKTNEKKYIELTDVGGGDSAQIHPDDAEEAGKILKNLDAAILKIKGKGDKREDFKLKQGLELSIKVDDDGVFISFWTKFAGRNHHVLLSEEEAVRFAPHLQKAKKMIGLVDKKVAP